MSDKHTRFSSYVYLTLAPIIFGSSFVMAKSFIRVMPISLFCCLTLGIGSLIAAPFIRKNEGKWLPSWSVRDWIIIFSQAFFGTFIYRLLAYNGLKFINAAESGIITSTTSAVVAFLSFLFLKENLSIYKIVGIISSIIGVVIINLSLTMHDPTHTTFVGVLLVCASVFMEALFSILSKFASKNVKSLSMSGIVAFLACLMFLPMGIYEAVHFDFSQLGVMDWLGIFYYGFAISILAAFFWFKGLSRVEVSRAAVFIGLVPVSSVILSYIFLSEKFLWAHVAGAVFVVAGIWCAAYKRKVPTVLVG
jgi:drug/metabolite transporter (DMT)-like permease